MLINTVLRYQGYMAVLDPQFEAWVGHCACVVETGLATKHWSGKSEGCA